MPRLFSYETAQATARMLVFAGEKALQGFFADPRDKIVAKDREDVLNRILVQRQGAFERNHNDPAVAELSALAGFVALHAPKTADELDRLESAQVQTRPMNTLMVSDVHNILPK